jgi:hypothetical protein
MTTSPTRARVPSGEHFERQLTHEVAISPDDRPGVSGGVGRQRGPVDFEDNGPENPGQDGTMLAVLDNIGNGRIDFSDVTVLFNAL